MVKKNKVSNQMPIQRRVADSSRSMEALIILGWNNLRVIHKIQSIIRIVRNMLRTHWPVIHWLIHLWWMPQCRLLLPAACRQSQERAQLYRLSPQTPNSMITITIYSELRKNCQEKCRKVQNCFRSSKGLIGRRTRLRP